MGKNKRNFNILLGFWILALIVYTVLLIINNHKAIVIDEIVLFCLLGIQLMVINCILMKQLKTLFDGQMQDHIKSEKRFLISTLTFFSLSYFIGIIKNILIFNVIETYNTVDNRLQSYFCAHP